MTIKGYNFYIDGVKATAQPQASPTYTFDGLSSDTEYSIVAVAVDYAGNESDFSDPLVTSTPAYAGDGSPLSAPDVAAVDAIVAASMAESHQPGVVLAIRGPRGYYTKAYGVTAGSGPRTLTIDDHFRIASLSKTFTTTAFWIAVDQGLVSLDDTLEQYVPGVANGTKITMRHMLSMRSGVYDYTADLGYLLNYILFPTNPYGEASQLAIIRSAASQFAPGTAFQYSNSNFILIGKVCSVVDPAQRPIKQIIAEDIITPLGLTETQWPDTAVIPAPAAGTSQIHPDSMGCAGGLTSTIGDIAKWGEAMRDGTLISEESWETWFNYFWPIEWVGTHPPDFCGYGLGMESVGRWRGHPGGIAGWGSISSFDMSSDIVIAVMENTNTASPAIACYTRIQRDIGAYFDASSVASPTWNNQVFGIAAPDDQVGSPVVGHHVLFDAVSGPVSSLFTAISISHTATAGAYVVLDVVVERAGAPTSPKYDGNDMTLLGSVNLNNTSSNGTLYRYGIASVSGGAKLVTAGAPGGYYSASVVSLNEVLSVGSTTSTFGVGVELSRSSVTCPEGGLVLHAFGQGSAGALLTSVSGGTNRVNTYASYSGLTVNTSMTTGAFAGTATGKTLNAWGSLATVFS